MTTSEDLSQLVDELLASMTIDEVISCLHQQVPAMPHHGLAAWHTGAETLHGVSWLGTATVFPQPVGLAATWDDDLLERIGDAVSTELRAMHAAEPEKVSLNCWAPVVNPLRNPLWGRNEEGYSEDPWVTAERASAYARGLRGHDEVFWKSVPTLKHLLAYNNETDRATCSANLSPRVLHEYDLPAFLGPIAEGVVGGVMPAYNLVNGRPCHISAEHYDAIREHNPDLLTVSDAWAPTNLTGCERVFDDDPTAHAAAINAGLDSFTDKDADSSHTTGNIRAALDAGLLTEEVLRRAARRVLWARALTGELSPDADPFADIPATAIDLPDHRKLAREAAAKQVVLLKNRGLLPLTDVTSIGVVGPLGITVKNDWYSGTPPYRVSVADAAAEVFSSSATSGADRVQLRSVTTGRLLARAEDGALVADRLVASDNDFEVTDWGWGQLTIEHLASGKLVRCADNGMALVDSERPQGWVAQEVFVRHVHEDGTVSLQHRGSRRWLHVEAWGGVVTATTDDLRNAERFVVEIVESGVAAARRVAAENDVVLVVVGNDPHIHGRETADRPGLGLAPAQLALWRAARAVNPNAVLVICSSYPYTLDGIQHDARAIVWTSHAGQELGHGLVDVLTGWVEPQGRLAQTWWAHQDQLADIFDYDAIGSRQTWWYSPHRPLFPFGHGLTYGWVSYDAIEVDGFGGEGAVARVTVTNHEPRVANELVQVYATSSDPEVGRRLLGARLVEVKGGQETVVDVPLDMRRIHIWNESSHAWRLPTCTWTVTAAPDAGAEGVSLDFETSSPEPVHAWPLRAWAVDERENVVGVPADVLRGQGLMGGRGGGRVRWNRVVTARPAADDSPTPWDQPIRIRMRAERGLSGGILLGGGGEGFSWGSRVALPDGHDGAWVEVDHWAPRGGWTYVTADIPEGVCLDTITLVDA